METQDTLQTILIIVLALLAALLIFALGALYVFWKKIKTLMRTVEAGKNTLFDAKNSLRLAKGGPVLSLLWLAAKFFIKRKRR